MKEYGDTHYGVKLTYDYEYKLLQLLEPVEREELIAKLVKEAEDAIRKNIYGVIGNLRG